MTAKGTYVPKALRSNVRRGTTVQRTVEDFIKKEYREYALYSLYSRAIPSIIDGLKRSQRKALYSTILHASNKQVKTAALGGLVIADANYHHGDASINTAISNMAQDFNCNLPLLNGHGAFGSRLVPDFGSPRYTFVSLNKKVFDKYFLDNDILEKYEDPEEPEPVTYLPIIPWVLVNGVTGIGTGFATNILPRNPDKLAELCLDYASGKNIDRRQVPPSVKGFKGEFFRKGKRWFNRGTFERIAHDKITITEIPLYITRESYIETLTDVINKNEDVKGYVDLCDDTGFKFTISFKRGVLKDLTDEDIYDMFGLEKGLSENITVINEDDVLQIFDNPIDLIKQFVDYRISKMDDRIEYQELKVRRRLFMISEMIRFINLVIDGEIPFKGKTRVQLQKIMNDEHDFTNKGVRDYLVSMPIHSLTKDNISKLEKEQKELLSQHKYWKSTNAKKEYLKSIKEVN